MEQDELNNVEYNIENKVNNNVDNNIGINADQVSSNRHMLIARLIANLRQRLKSENTDDCDAKIENQELENSEIEENNSIIEETESTNTILVIDRFESNFAICENRKTGEMVNIEKQKLPDNISEGDVLKIVDNEFIIDEQTKKEIEERIKRKVSNIFEEEE